MNSKTIADAIAARFVGITANGETIAHGPTASLPNDITSGPALLVYPPTGELEVGEGGTRLDRLTFLVRLLRDPTDVPTRTDALYAWYDAMRDRVEMATSLGLPTYVEQSQPISSRLAIDGQSYAGHLFDVVELGIEVKLFEHVTTIGP